MARGPRIALLAYGALNAVLYCNLLPLWDGFDEPFHYAFVQHLSRTGQLPVTGQSVISGEVQRSLELAPGSHLVQRNLPFITTFADYLGLPAEERTRRRGELAALRSSGPSHPTGGPNYEAQQAPLAYALLAPFDRLWRDTPLLSRVLRLRLLCALGAVLAVGILALRICESLDVPETF